MSELDYLRCDDCDRPVSVLFNCWCHRTVCPKCRDARHGEHTSPDHQEKPRKEVGT